MVSATWRAQLKLMTMYTGFIELLYIGSNSIVRTSNSRGN